MWTSKYFILVAINLPLVIIGTLGAIASYKTRRTSKKKSAVQVAFWIAVGIGLFLVEPGYNALVKNNLTDSPPMSLFDVVLLTLLLFSLLFIKNANQRISLLNAKLSRMHEDMVISGEWQGRRGESELVRPRDTTQA